MQPALGAAGVKWVSGFPGNAARGLPYISGLLILNDPETGMPKAVMDATWITAMRTGGAAQDFQHQFLADQDDDNGLERFITATRRQNFLVPPRRHRAFPLVEFV